MLNTDSNTIQVPLANPNFSLVLLSMESSGETKSAINSVYRNLYQNNSTETICQVIKDSTIKINELGERGIKHFFTNLPYCNLSEIETAFCQRAQTVFNISSVRNSASFFAPFWACQAVAQDLAHSVESIIIDMHQGNIVTTDGDNNERDAFGIPLTAKYLTVKGYHKEDAPNRFLLYTEGMSRFGLPELTLPEVPSNLLNDGAYLLRAIAQFLWSKLERIHPEQPHLELAPELEISAAFCEYGNPAFHARNNELLIPFALDVSETEHETLLVVKNPTGYDDYYDWLLSVNESILELRLDIQLSYTADERIPAATIIAA